MQKTFLEEIESGAVPIAPAKQLRLRKLTLRNFMGIRDFTLRPEGASVGVYANNGVGKTTLYSAWNFLLFGKDAAGRADFSLKPLNAQGEALHGLTTAVEAEVEIDGQVRTFLKEYEEKWVKQRGSATRQFSGHTTNHFVDGVPTKQADFQAAIAELADERTFRLLTDPTYFSEGLHWQERRKILLEVCGDVSDADVIASDAQLADLPGILGSRSMDDHRKVVAAKKQEINKTLLTLPVRIDECSLALPEPVANPKQLQKQVEKLRLAREEAEQEITRINAGGEIAEKKKRLAEISAQMLDLETKARREASDRYYTAVNATKGKLSDVLTEIRSKESEISSHQGHVESCRAQIEALESRMDRLRAEWDRIDATGLDESGVATACLACGQNLPAEKVEAARQKANEEFNAQKSRKLTQIEADGKRMKAEVADLKSTVEHKGAESDRLAKEVEQLREKADKLQVVINDTPPPAEPKLPKEHGRLAHERGTLELGIGQLLETTEPALAAAREKITGLSKDISELETSLQSVELRAKGEARIEELKSDEKRLAGEFEELERQNWLCEEFIRRKIEMLTSRINGRFEMVSFRLFETQVNGGITEVCETTFNGVPYQHGLNHGARVNAGLDVIRTLQRHFGFCPPIWIDGRESVTKLLEMDGQVISLIVSEADKRLRVETTTT